ncbi:hypothetical protein J2Z49_001915 [Desulfofundulus luciae]|uniref:Transposase IS116/IS110/IS902 C-terminal domain-containing protein n=1 Tax=Desulfofundulus luciae TaxID=74702 RepID=A0ABU0B246_9FIRM|nr:hypothetical protein [Desulfofundulus luciae]
MGDLNNYRNARQLIKLAGLNLVENSSGIHNGRTRISKRGRAKLSCALFRVALVIVARTQKFSIFYHYYTTRPNSPLKGKQSLVAICCRLLRIIFALDFFPVSVQLFFILPGFKLCRISLFKVLPDGIPGYTQCPSYFPDADPLGMLVL